MRSADQHTRRHAGPHAHTHAQTRTREREGDFPVWLFAAEELSFDVTVLPADVLRQAPLSGIDGKPMRRASAAQLRALLAEDEIAGYEASA